MFSLLALTSNSSLGGATPLGSLKEQLAYLYEHGVSTTLLVDPLQPEFELAVASGIYDAAYVISANSYPGGNTAASFSYLQLLEYYGLPAIGSGYFKQLLINDKCLCGYRSGIAPPGVLITRAAYRAYGLSHLHKQIQDLAYPLIVKPNNLSGSLGIDAASIVTSHEAIGERVGDIFRRLHFLTEIRLETYISGAREITVGIVGNSGSTRESVSAIVPKDGTQQVYGEIDKKTSLPERRFYYASVEPEIRREVVFHARRLFEHLKLRDHARFDFLFTDRAYLIDVNALPVLGSNFSWEWQATYGLEKRQLLALALAAFQFRLLREGRPISLPRGLLDSLPNELIAGISGPRREAATPESTPPQPHCRRTDLFTMVDRVAAENEVLDLLYGLVRATKPEFALETGTYKGATALMIGLALQDNGRGRLVTLENDPQLALGAVPGLSRLPVRVVSSDSRRFMPPQPVDFLYLDSSRIIRGEEFSHFLPFLADCAVIVWHDSSPANEVVFSAIESLKDRGVLDRILLPTPRGVTISMKRDWLGLPNVQ